jgi:hypothetical protein
MNGVINPQLGPLTYNGGPVLPDGSPMLTHALLSGSPALDAGDPAAMLGVGIVPLYDQRGMPFSRVVDGNGMDGARIDMGSYERQESAPFHLFVDTLADELDGDYSSGDFSLREAVEIANLNPDADTISFAPALTADGPATILLTQGELLITDSLTITGPGTNLLKIDASGSDPTPDSTFDDQDNLNDGDGNRIFNVDDGDTTQISNVLLAGMRLTGGDSTNGGAVRHAARNESLKLQNIVIEGNHSSYGGAILVTNAGTLGAAQSDSLLTLEGCTIRDNVGVNGSGGIAVEFADITITDCVVENNRVIRDGDGTYGGGIQLRATSLHSLTINRSVITRNSAPIAVGGGIQVRSAGLPERPHVLIQNSSLSENIASRGGALFFSGVDAQIIDSQIDGNASVTVDGALGLAGTRGFGGGIESFSSTIHILRSSLVNNSVSGPESAQGGGIWLSTTNLTIENSTVSQNSATTGGGIWANSSASVSLIHSTVHENTASESAGGIHFEPSVGATPLTLDHSIIAGNSAPTSPDLRGVSSSGVSARYSLIGNYEPPIINPRGTSVGTASGMPDEDGNLIGNAMHAIDPLLGPLTYNGGPVFLDSSVMLTHALLPGSPALDAGDSAAMAGMNGVPLYDQRGMPFSRIANGDDIPEARIDIGALEWQPNPLPGDYNYSGVVDAADFVLWRKSLEPNGDLRADGDGDGDIDQDDYAVWRANFGAVAASPPVASAAAVQHPDGGDNSVADPKPRMPFDTSANTIRRRSESLPVARQRTDEAATVNDEALLAWLDGMKGGVGIPQPSTTVALADEQSRISTGNSLLLDVVFAAAESDGL